MSKEIIKTTKEYKKFQVYTSNRSINEGLVKRLMESIKDLGYIEGKPVIVDKNFTIIDGQHRYTACVRLDIPVHYIVTDADPQKAMIQLNAQQINWKVGDYIHNWADQGVKCYIHLLDFEKRRGLGVSNAIYILFNQQADTNKKIKNGFKFTINSNAEKIGAFIKDCDQLPYYKSAMFVRALVAVWDDCSADQIDKLKAAMMSLKQQPNSAAYIQAFENIVNKGLAVKNRVSFKSTV